ncbi:hypothetical protein [Cognatishimia sp.]|uniref:hypothetical protein n=1 Tax=Cognatishimia sp. TaxID=2211648 RepID=UPI003BAA3C28
MRVVAKKSYSQPSSFWANCGALFKAALENSPPDEMMDRLNILASKLGVRTRAVYQMTSMAKLFGLSPQRLQTPEMRAHKLLGNCGTCKMAGRCFTNAKGKKDDHAHVSPKACPNFLEFQTMAREIGSRSAIKNKLL